MKEYQTPELDVVLFAPEDVITTSIPAVENEPGVYAAPNTDLDLF